jgi:hypothetical protein
MLFSLILINIKSTQFINVVKNKSLDFDNKTEKKSCRFFNDDLWFSSWLSVFFNYTLCTFPINFKFFPSVCRTQIFKAIDRYSLLALSVYNAWFNQRNEYLWSKSLFAKSINNSTTNWFASTTEKIKTGSVA